jgi:hypothetical protein
MAIDLKKVALRVANSYINIELARKAKNTLKMQLNRPPWLRGIGIGVDTNGSHLVRVMVSEMTDEIQKLIPSSIEKVPVKIDVVGNIIMQ